MFTGAAYLVLREVLICSGGLKGRYCSPIGTSIRAPRIGFDVLE